ncbi:FkbM family methyltransferase [Bdellovibrio sp. HCB2-146]|uniref:FkbM family methyltransferase n=1 Tax=Bdellovibrio sp. HCB2-146 TaxID=3394362 RepID=UPI0039BC28B7
MIVSIFKKVFRRLKDPSYLYFYWLKLRYRRAKRMTAMTLNSPDGSFAVSDIQSFIYQYKEIFVDRIYDFESKSANPVIVDCGSNIGLSVRFFKSLYKDSTIYAIEPDLHINTFLRQNIDIIPTNKNIHIIPKAAWKTNSFLSFKSDGADGGTLVGANAENKIECFDFSDWLLQFDKIDFMKVDIEGAEYDVLLHSKDHLNKVQNLFVEYHSFKNKPQVLSELLDLLRTNGFRVYLDCLSQRQSPFKTKPQDGPMDLQLNIFASRIDPNRIS